MRLSTAVAFLALLLVSAAPASAQGPQVEVTTPLAGATIPGTQVTVTTVLHDAILVPSTIPLAEAGKHPEVNRPGEGHLHFMLDLQPLVVWDRAEPYVFTNVAPGQHQLMVEFVNNDHASFAPPILQQLSFRTDAAMVLPNTGAAQTDSRDDTLVLSLAILGCLLVGTSIVLRRTGSARR